MKILVNSINHSPDLTGIGKYTGEMVKWLVENGHEVKVVTAPPYYPEWRVKKGYSKLLYKTEIIDNAKVIRCPLWVPSKPSGLKRIIHLASFALTAFPVMLWKGMTWRPDIVFVVEPPIMCVPGALFTGWLSDAKKWLHIQDFEVDAAFDLGILKSKKLRAWITGIETFLMRRFDVVSTISIRMQEKLHIKGVSEKNTLLFENWVETHKIYPLTSTPPLHSELNLPKGRLIILYSGNMGEKQGLEIIVKAAEKLSNREDIYFVLCGAGSSKERLKQLSLQLSNICFLPLQPLDKLNELLNLAYVHLLPQQAGMEDLVMPSKLTNMMASGKPVIATVMPQTQIAKVLDGCGIIVEPGDLLALCNAIVELVSDKDKANELGKNARDFVENNWEINMVLSDIYSQLTDNP